MTFEQLSLKFIKEIWNGEEWRRVVALLTLHGMPRLQHWFGSITKLRSKWFIHCWKSEEIHQKILIRSHEVHAFVRMGFYICLHLLEWVFTYVFTCTFLCQYLLGCNFLDLFWIFWCNTSILLELNYCINLFFILCLFVCPFCEL